MKRKITVSKRDLAAADWVLKFERGFSADEQDKFSSWLADNPENKELFALHSWSWDELDRLAGLQSIECRRIDKDILNIEKQELNPAIVRFRKALYWIVLPMAACVVFAALLTLNKPDGFGGDLSVNHSKSQVNVSEIPRLQKTTLEDGTVVTLNYDSEITSQYNEDVRFIKLLKGEASFDVVKDNERPFVVSVGGVKVTAVGTEFNIRMQGEVIDVIVAEGRVELSGEIEQSASGASIQVGVSYLDASEQMVIYRDENQLQFEKKELSSQYLEEKLLWQPKLLEFHDITLREITKEFNRRNHIQIHIEGRALNELRLSSLFWSDNIEGFIRLLQKSLDVEVMWLDESTILVELK